MTTRELIAEQFNLKPEEVNDEQVKAFEAVITKSKSGEAGMLPAIPADVTKAADVAGLREELETTKATLAEVKLEGERAIADLKTRPAVDPDTHAIAADRVSRMKSFPVINKFCAAVPQDDNESALQTVLDSVYSLSILRGVRKYVDYGQVPMRKLAWWDEIKDLQPSFAKALDTATAAEGAEWAPTQYTSQVNQAVIDKTVIAQLLPQVTMPKDSYKNPFGLTGGTAYYGGEATNDDPAEATPSTPATGDTTFTAKRIYALFNYSEELEDNSLVALIPQLNARIAEVVAEGIEDAIVSGDTTATHMDSNVTSAADVKRCWNGLRHFAAVTLTTAFKSLATFDGATIGSIYTAMAQKYVLDTQDLVAIWPAKSRIPLTFLVHNSTNNIPLFMRSTALGDNAVQRGVFGDMFGHPQVLSSRIPVNLNAAGVYDGTTTTKTCVIMVSRKAWEFGDRKQLTLTIIPEPLKFRSRLLATWRGGLNMIGPATDVHTGGGYNF